MTILDLFESMAPAKLYHYTNEFALENILEKGYLRTRDYPGDKDKKTLPVVRASMTNKKNLDNLSDEIGNVRFVINRENLTSGKIRGLKQTKINEFVKEAIDHLSNIFGSRKKALEMIKLYKKDENEYLKNLHKTNKNKYEDIITTSYIRQYIKYSKKREGEERFYTKSNSNIPIKYMKIELLPGFIDDLNKMLAMKYSSKKLVNEIIKNKNLFIKNTEWKKFVKFVELFERIKKK